MLTPEVREAVRRAYSFRCGYCGVHENDIGAELEIDHFEPRSLGGGDEIENLVYCCAACNRRKGDFWPSGELTTTQRRLLHPLQDDLTSHIREEQDGRLMALSEIGAFHIKRLFLNRPQLVASRLKWREESRKEAVVASSLERQNHLREATVDFERRIRQIFDEIDQLLKP